MQLFDEETKAQEPEPPEGKTVSAVLDAETLKMLSSLQSAGSDGPINRSEVIRQCIRLGHRIYSKRKSGHAHGGGS